MEARQMKVLNVLVNPFIENARGAKMLEEGELQQVVSKFPHFGSTIYEECGQNNVDAPLRPVGRVSDENIIMANRRASEALNQNANTWKIKVRISLVFRSLTVISRHTGRRWLVITNLAAAEASEGAESAIRRGSGYFARRASLPSRSSLIF
ncbi:uncharacterized protein OCT59_014457 [Rhizophagus irregularis]|uniref:uncharacterized protein n=1 Tax=Rhizophagus irregularis TaxID=588596 RepID=UPI00332D4D76|nr:hypothetical protein OCT59_014457 [Rhizophagus irregularis]